MGAMPRPSAAFRWFAVLAALGAWALVAVGGLVRVTESGLGCPDWPLCDGRVIPRSEQAARNSARKAWRFVGEMEEIAASFEEAGLPGGFHRAAAEIYRRLESYKDTSAPPAVAEVVASLTSARTE